jgi:large subunit ribosomal protein L6
MIIMIEIKLPEGVKAEANASSVTTSGKLGANTRKFNSSLLNITAGADKIIIDHVKAKKLSDKAANAEKAFSKELANDIKGVCDYYELRMKSVHAHFPITVEVKCGAISINNIIGERVPRHAGIAGSTKVEVKGQNVRLYGTSLDDVSQTAANIRKACRMKNKDTRVFQDGIYFEV